MGNKSRCKATELSLEGRIKRREEENEKIKTVATKFFNIKGNLTAIQMLTIDNLFQHYTKLGYRSIDAIDKAIDDFNLGEKK